LRLVVDLGAAFGAAGLAATATLRRADSGLVLADEGAAFDVVGLAAIVGLELCSARLTVLAGGG
jgi:hypothetical protein